MKTYTKYGVVGRIDAIAETLIKTATIEGLNKLSKRVETLEKALESEVNNPEPFSVSIYLGESEKEYEVVYNTYGEALREYRKAVESILVPIVYKPELSTSSNETDDKLPPNVDSLQDECQDEIGEGHAWYEGKCVRCGKPEPQEELSKYIGMLCEFNHADDFKLCCSGILSTIGDGFYESQHDIEGHRHYAYCRPHPQSEELMRLRKKNKQHKEEIRYHKEDISYLEADIIDLKSEMRQFTKENTKEIQQLRADKIDLESAIESANAWIDELRASQGYSEETISNTIKQLSKQLAWNTPQLLSALRDTK